MNTLTQFKKDHPALFHLYLGLIVQALIPALDAALQELSTSQVALSSVAKVSAVTFLVTLATGVIHYTTTDKSVPPEIAQVAAVAAPYIQQEAPKMIAAVTPLPLPARPPVANSKTFIEPPAGDFTWAKTTQGPIVFPAPLQAPVAPNSAFHDLIQTQTTPTIQTPPKRITPVDESFLTQGPPTPLQG